VAYHSPAGPASVGRSVLLRLLLARLDSGFEGLLLRSGLALALLFGQVARTGADSSAGCGPRPVTGDRPYRDAGSGADAGA